MSEAVRIAVGLIWSDGRLVVGRRNTRSVLAGFDEFPGGKCDGNESAAACVVRECFEETGFQIMAVGRRAKGKHVYDHGTLDIEFFDCVLRGDKPNPSEPHAPFYWAGVAEVLRLHFPDANQAALDSLREHPYCIGEKTAFTES